MRTLRLAAAQPRAVHRVGAPLEQRCEQHRQILRVVLEIRVLYDDEVAASSTDALADGRALSSIPIAPVNEEVLHLARQALARGSAPWRPWNPSSTTTTSSTRSTAAIRRRSSSIVAPSL